MLCRQISSISFKKTLVAKTNILKNNQPCSVSIYELKKREDKDYFEKLLDDKKWKNSRFLVFMKKHFEKSVRYKFTGGPNLKFYSLEDKKQNCLGLVEVDNSRFDTQNILYIESFPLNKKNKEYKYIGETLLAFLTKQQQMKIKPKKLFINFVVTGAEPFYLKSHFGFENTCKQMSLRKDNQKLLIESNKEHTQSEIELVRKKKC